MYRFCVWVHLNRHGGGPIQGPGGALAPQASDFFQKKIKIKITYNFFFFFLFFFLNLTPQFVNAESALNLHITSDLYQNFQTFVNFVLESYIIR